MQIEADQGQLPNELSMPLALVLNELVTNAAKHGSTAAAPGTSTGSHRIMALSSCPLKTTGQGSSLRKPDAGPRG